MTVALYLAAGGIVFLAIDQHATGLLLLAASIARAVFVGLGKRSGGEPASRWSHPWFFASVFWMVTGVVGLVGTVVLYAQGTAQREGIGGYVVVTMIAALLGTWFGPRILIAWRHLERESSNPERREPPHR